MQYKNLDFLHGDFATEIEKRFKQKILNYLHEADFQAQAFQITTYKVLNWMIEEWKRHLMNTDWNLIYREGGLQDIKYYLNYSADEILDGAFWHLETGFGRAKVSLGFPIHSKLFSRLVYSDEFVKAQDVIARFNHDIIGYIWKEVSKRI